jgi:hypothetical protein
LRQIGLKEPLVKAGQETRDAEQPAQRTPEAVLAAGRGEEGEDHQQHEADVDRADHLAGERMERRHPDLVRRERDRNPEQGAARGVSLVWVGFGHKG